MLTTLDKVKIQLNIVWNDQDTKLIQLIDQANSFILNYTGRVLEETLLTELYNGNGEQKFMLNNFPVTSITSFQYNTGTLWTPVWTDFDIDSYWLDKTTGIIYIQGWVCRGVNKIKCIYTAWYNPVPSDLENACISLVWYYYNTSKSQGIASESLDGASVTYSNNAIGSTIPNEIIQTLNLYKKIYV